MYSAHYCVYHFRTHSKNITNSKITLQNWNLLQVLVRLPAGCQWIKNGCSLYEWQASYFYTSFLLSTTKDTLPTFPNLRCPPLSYPRARKIVSALHFYPTAPSKSRTSFDIALVGLISHHNHLNPKVILHRQHLSRMLKLTASNACAYKSFKALQAYSADIRSSAACFSLISLAIARVCPYSLTSTIKVFWRLRPWVSKPRFAGFNHPYFQETLWRPHILWRCHWYRSGGICLIQNATVSARPQRVSSFLCCLMINRPYSITSSTQRNQYVNISIYSNEQRRATNPDAFLGLDSPWSSQPYQPLRWLIAHMVLTMVLLPDSPGIVHQLSAQTW